MCIGWGEILKRRIVKPLGQTQYHVRYGLQGRGAFARTAHAFFVMARPIRRSLNQVGFIGVSLIDIA